MTEGPTLFVRYALAPNRLGYCGPSDGSTFFEYGVTGRVDPGLRTLARQFEGAWPQLQRIAAASGAVDPLDREVVEAYWIGNRLLDRAGTAEGELPHHSFQVFCAYPWFDLLDDERSSEQALRVLDQCRIRWGRVVADTGEHVVVESRPLVRRTGGLVLGPLRQETVIRGVDGMSLVGPLRPGEWVSLHWEWVCDRLTPAHLAALRRYSAHHLELANQRHALVR
ncbi:hypothetical protein FB561_3116 [Kribbella amoyensis]|uniref:Uncharacterized protein n=1 Tax=Kribbella amoyensis TaxID=996641 RepID=A0A561BT54_9ACTN|nr:DUF6390 family protein [Kribbella amoyensis]TWD81992.1 hypothetical protein FB561_3116 [Kribbella amoyensis]